MDGSAYVDSPTWQRILAHAKQDVVSVREGQGTCWYSTMHCVTTQHSPLTCYAYDAMLLHNLLSTHFLIHNPPSHHTRSIYLYPNPLPFTSTPPLGRYDAVFHLVTAAQGAERFYTLDNNQARSESPQEARDVDERLVASWNGHPRHYIIDNNGR